jgi:hypothetical protein
MGITVPRATCRQCLRHGAGASGLPAFLRVALLIGAALVGVSALLIYLAR